MEDTELIEELRKYNLHLKDDSQKLWKEKIKLEEEIKFLKETAVKLFLVSLLLVIFWSLFLNSFSYKQGYFDGIQSYKQKYCAALNEKTSEYQKCLEDENTKAKGD